MEFLGMVPAHAVAIRIYSLPAAAAATGSSLLCAWLVAAVAAAVGLWRIRAAAGAFKTGTGVRSGRSALVVGEKKARVVAPLLLPPPAAHEPRPAAAAPAVAARPASPTVEPSTPSKVRFTAYYYYGGGSVHDDDDGVVDGVRNCAGADEDGGCESEMVLRRMTASGPAKRSSTKSLAAATWGEREMAARWRGDLGWYRHLDMAALDGSVVRLWDGGELTASPRGRRRRQEDWNFSCHSEVIRVIQ